MPSGGVAFFLEAIHFAVVGFFGIAQLRNHPNNREQNYVNTLAVLKYVNN